MVPLTQNTNPSPAPAAAPAPTPAPASSAPSSSPEVDPFDAEFAAEANRAVSGEAPHPKPADPAPAPPPPPAKPADKAPVQPAATPAPKPSEGPKQLREELDRVKAERDAHSQKLASYEKLISVAEAKGKDTAALSERAAALEKQIAERDAELRALKQEASPEFKSKYEAPFAEAAEYAREVVGQLVVTSEDDVGNKTTRPATWDDFAALYNQPYSKSIEQATAMFGPAAQVVINHLTELHRLDNVRARALKSERENAAARMKEEDGKRVQSQEAAAAAMAKLHAELPQKYEAYRDPPEDKELADARAEQFAQFDEEPKSPQQAMLKWAHIRQRWAAHKPLLMQNARLKAKIAQLESDLAGKTTKEPDPGRHPGGSATGVATSETWDGTSVPKELANVT